MPSEDRPPEEQSPGAAEPSASAPKIEFPCPDYPIKVFGEASPDYVQQVVEIIRVHAPELDMSKVSVNDSRGGRYQAVTVKIIATGEPQLQSIFKDLKDSGRVRMVL